MPTLNDLVRQHTSYTGAQRAHLRRLIGSWGLLADLGFSALLLFAKARTAEVEPRLVVLGQLRPATAQTLYVDDEIGKLIPVGERPLVVKAFATAEIQEQDRNLRILNRRVRVMAIPVVHEGQVLAVVSRENRQLEDRVPSELEFAYLQSFRRLARMMVEGTVPFPFEDIETEEAPRVGDGLLVLDESTRVRYSSPNAVSVLHRAGYHGRINDRRLVDFGFDSHLVESAFRLQVPILQELERGDDVSVLARIVPIVEGSQTTGALVQMRDVSDLRRRDRMLVSMDATIREIHHRVKNNLQTVSSLLRIQGRRLESPEAKSVIDESVRRVQSIAIIHEMLSTSAGDRVAFADVVLPIMQMAEAGLVSADRPIRFNLVGEGPTLSASRASSLAVVVNELLQNAIEHGFPPGTDGGVVTVELLVGTTDVRVRVHDDGVGVPEGFDPARTEGLGLTIISTLVSGELDGELKIRPAVAPQKGTVAEVRVQAVDEE